MPRISCILVVGEGEMVKTNLLPTPITTTTLRVIDERKSVVKSFWSPTLNNHLVCAAESTATLHNGGGCIVHDLHQGRTLHHHGGRRQGGLCSVWKHHRSGHSRGERFLFRRIRGGNPGAGTEGYCSCT